jgi:hypothetical protein
MLTRKSLSTPPSLDQAVYPSRGVVSHEDGKRTAEIPNEATQASLILRSSVI